jgi:phosphoglycolate phosphatase
MNYELAIFDFDGTLADSFPFFLSVFNDLARQHNFREFGATDIHAMRHKSARELMKVTGLPAWKLPRVARSFIALMKENASSIGMFAGVPEMLDTLSQRGMKIAIVSSNSRENAEIVLGSSARHIQHWECGMSIFGKTSRIHRVMRASGITPARTIYIGDQISDLDAAHKAGIAFGAVEWGYAAAEALRSRNPARAFSTVSDITSVSQPA